ncbi:nitrate- and nitrite sensing domain-containing protein [Alteromonas sp. AMM-1]|uniref:nitrate- and nitrite sensing domain-containing protein n=1 Tax=Alteromonas sp. AMM-1 TaxID=3394233 RepID=UPI0039A60CD2
MSMLILGMVLLLIGLIAFQWFRSRRLLKQRLYNALELIGSIKKIISYTQKHRGLTASYLQGNQSVRNELLALKQQISGIADPLKHNDMLKREERWESYQDHWSRLKGNAESLTVASSFQQHTHLIETLLYLLEDVAENIEFGGEQQATPQIHFLWHEFPKVIEFIGQARAIGVAVATKGESTQIDKVKLGYLYEKINTLSSQSFDRLTLLQAGSSIAQIEQAKQACLTLTKTIREQLINVSKVTLTSQEYFNLASHTMDLCNTVLDNEINAIKHNYR